nr:MAG TPA: baseplate protein [Caudoviricetes sp.]
MASNGSFNTNSYDGRHVQFSWNVASQSVANNNTTINWSISAVGGSSSWYRSNPTGVYINGNCVYYNGTRVQQYKGTIASGSYTIGHNSEGNASFSASVSSAIYSASVNCNGSGSWSLPQIARASQPSCITWPNTTENIGDIGSTITIHMNSHSSAFTHTVRYSFYDLNETIATGVKDNCRWTIPDSFYSKMPNLNSSWGTIYADTYNGSTKIGTKSVKFTCNVANANPEIDKIDYYDSNQKTSDITEDNQIIIRNNSNLEFKLTNLIALKYATLSKVEILLNGITKSATLSGSSVPSKIINFGIVNSSSNLTASISVIDSRGNKTSYSKDITIVDWVQPSAIITCQRENNFYSTTHLTVDGSISSINDKNVIKIQYQYKKTTDTNYSTLNTIQDNTQTSFEIDNKFAWDIRVIVSDLIGSTTYNLFVDKGIPIVYFDRLLSSMGVNCFPKYDNSFEANGVSLSGKVLYNSANGTAETVTLSDSAENYTYLEIFYRSSGDNACGSVKVFSPNGKLVHLGTIHYIADYDYAKFALVSVSESMITFSQNYQITLKSNGSTYSAENAIFITRVVGY